MAVKILDLKSMDKLAIARVKQELIILNEVNHPGIVKIFKTYGDLSRPSDYKC